MLESTDLIACQGQSGRDNYKTPGSKERICLYSAVSSGGGVLLNPVADVEVERLVMTATILLVDDSPTILRMLELGLIQAGYKVVTALNGLEGLEKLKQEPIDLIVSDINMPRMHGITFITLVRKKSQWANLPIILLSTETGTHDQKRGLDAGANLYLTKPISHHKLIAQIEKLLDQSQH